MGQATVVCLVAAAYSLRTRESRQLSSATGHFNDDIKGHGGVFDGVRVLPTEDRVRVARNERKDHFNGAMDQVSRSSEGTHVLPSEDQVGVARNEGGIT